MPVRCDSGTTDSTNTCMWNNLVLMNAVNERVHVSPHGHCTDTKCACDEKLTHIPNFMITTNTVPPMTTSA